MAGMEWEDEGAAVGARPGGSPGGRGQPWGQEGQGGPEVAGGVRDEDLLAALEAPSQQQGGGEGAEGQEGVRDEDLLAALEAPSQQQPGSEADDLAYLLLETGGRQEGRGRQPTCWRGGAGGGGAAGGWQRAGRRSVAEGDNDVVQARLLQDRRCRARQAWAGGVRTCSPDVASQRASTHLPRPAPPSQRTRLRGPWGQEPSYHPHPARPARPCSSRPHLASSCAQAGLGGGWAGWAVQGVSRRRGTLPACLPVHSVVAEPAPSPVSPDHRASTLAWTQSTPAAGTARARPLNSRGWGRLRIR